MKTLYAVVRLDIEQATNPDGSYVMPIKYKEVPSYVTRWETDKNKTYAKLRQLMKDAKAKRGSYPKFGVAEEEAESVAKAVTS